MQPARWCCTVTSMETNTFTAIFRNGQRATRTSAAAYTHASRDGRGKVRFHTSESAARKAVGRDGAVVTVNNPCPSPAAAPAASDPLCSVCGHAVNDAHRGFGIADHPEVGKVHSGPCVSAAIRAIRNRA